MFGVVQTSLAHKMKPKTLQYQVSDFFNHPPKRDCDKKERIAVWVMDTWSLLHDSVYTV